LLVFIQILKISNIFRYRHTGKKERREKKNEYGFFLFHPFNCFMLIKQLLKIERRKRINRIYISD